MKHKMSICLCAAFILLTFQTSAKAAADNILSGNIKEADGTTGQNTNAGSGVKRDHIQDGAVTDAKILGPISVAKLPVGTSAVTVAAGDHNHEGLYLKKYGKVAIVAQSGGDFTSPVDAMSDIDLWCGTPSLLNPCLLKIMPGFYNVGAQQILLPAFVDIEGSGEGTTRIVGNVASFIMMSSSELRSLTVEVVASSGNWGIGVTGGSAKFTDFTLKFSGYIGMYTTEAELAMRNVTFLFDAVGIGLLIENGGSPAADLDNVRIQLVNGSGTGIVAVYGAANVVLRNCKIDGAGIAIQSNALTLRNSEISGTVFGIDGLGNTVVGSKISGGQNSMRADAGTKVSFSEIVGPIDPLYGAGMSCYGVHDENYNAVTCP